jgi:hypothetical protein
MEWGSEWGSEWGGDGMEKAARDSRVIKQLFLNV